jgi:hypothetical protein
MIYGLLRTDAVIIGANAVSFALVGVVLYFTRTPESGESGRHV